MNQISKGADSLVNALPKLAISSGPCGPWNAMLLLKSSAALPNHIRMIKKDVIPAEVVSQDVHDAIIEPDSPMMNPKNPIHADKRWTIGLSKAAVILAPIL